MSFYLPDFENFCQILLQRPFAWGSAGMLFTSRVTEEDLTIMTKLAQGHFEKVIIILKQLPRSMLLVFRCGYSVISLRNSLFLPQIFFARFPVKWHHSLAFFSQVHLFLISFVDFFMYF